MVQIARFRINTPDVVSETIDGESVIINLSTGSYYSLNSAGAEIWSLLETSVSFQSLVKRLTEKYSGSSLDIQQAVEQLIQQLQQESLVVPVSEAVADIDEQIAGAPTPEKLPFEIPVLQKYTDMEDLLLLDPIHEVDEQAGWPNQKIA